MLKPIARLPLGWIINQIKIACFLLIGGLLSFSLSAEDFNSGNISLSIDNDSITGTDREYSSGVYLKFNSSSEVDVNKLEPLPIKYIASILPLYDKTKKIWGVTLGQKMWTPTDIEIEEEVIRERPYSGLLFAEVHLNEYSSSTANKYHVMLGEVGPRSYAEPSQKLVHKLINSPTPQGWDQQIESKVVFTVGYEGQREIIREEDWLNHDIDMAAIGRVNISNFQSEVAVGTSLRWGTQLSDSFGAVSLQPGKIIDPNAFSTSEQGYFGYLAFEGRYRHNDYTIEGARPKHLYDVDVQNLQSTLATGLVYYQASWGVALSFALNTKNYEQDIENFNSFASIEFIWRF